MGSAEQLLTVSAPFFTTLDTPRALAAEASGWQGAGLLVRAVRGRKARSLDRLFDEFVAAFQFPYYFGENWAAFRDCLSDLDWLEFKPGVVVLIHDADQMLADAPEAELVTLVKSFAMTAGEFAEPLDVGESWDRGPVPFHVVLQGSHDRDFDRWAGAGAELTRLG